MCLNKPLIDLSNILSDLHFVAKSRYIFVLLNNLQITIFNLKVSRTKQAAFFTIINVEFGYIIF